MEGIMHNMFFKPQFQAQSEFPSPGTGMKMIRPNITILGTRTASINCMFRQILGRAESCLENSCQAAFGVIRSCGYGAASKQSKMAGGGGPITRYQKF